MAFKGYQAIACEWSFFSTAAFFVSLRLYVRLFKTKNPTPADYVILFSLFCFCSTCICDTISKDNGLFADNLTYNSDLRAAIADKKALVIVLKLLYGSAFPYYFDMYGVKLSFLLLYYGLIPRTLPKLRMMLYITTALVAIGLLTTCLVNAFWCWPVPRNWSLTSSVCFAYSSAPAYFLSTAFHIITDIAIFCLPFPLLKSLSLTNKQFYGVISVFALGGVCILCTIARTIAVGLEANIAQVGLWTSLEQATGLAVASAPALKAFMTVRSQETSRVRASRNSRTSRMLASGMDRTKPAALDVEESWIRMDSPESENYPRLQDTAEVQRNHDQISEEPLKRLEVRKDDHGKSVTAVKV